MAVFTMVRTGKKSMQFGIFIFLQGQEKHLTSNLRGSECDEYCKLHISK